MITIKKIYKKDVSDLMLNQNFWNHEFLSITKHRLLAHCNNPNLNNDDIVLILSYLDNELVGYMGIFIDKIILGNIEQKIGWLSTWWVHPKTKGSGIGREILNTMYAENDGKIGISQFTPSAKRVYDKSAFFVDLKQNVGLKAVLKSNFAQMLPLFKPSLVYWVPLLKIFDELSNFIIELYQYFYKKHIFGKVNHLKIEYLSEIDNESRSLINQYNCNHLSKKSDEFFNWLKRYPWVLESPLIELTEKSKYEFSMVANRFQIYLTKVIDNNVPIGFVVLQIRDNTLKVLFAYYGQNHVVQISNIIKLQAINQGIYEIICYDRAICSKLKQAKLFIYQRKKIKNSIISKAFNKDNFDEIIMNYGDGDCCFA